MRTITTTVLVTTFAFLASGCVSKGKYDEAVADAWTARVDLDKSRASLARANEEVFRLNQDREQRERETARLRLELYLQDRAAGADRRYASTRVAEMAKRLAEIERAQAAAEAQAAFHRALSERFRSQISAGDLDVVVRDDRMVLRLPNDVLFDTGRTEIKPAGRAALAEIASVLASYPDRHFQIAGHTDDVPIKNDRFPSNWELSTARALAVVHFLVAHGVAPDALSAAGYASVDPLGPNVTADGRKRNRRTEITVQPAIRDAK